MNTLHCIHSSSTTVISSARRQAGFTLMEAMISMALSLVVTSAMVVLMANSMGTTSRVIQMTQLTDQLRNTMSMLTRDIRRANYSPDSAYCYANADCGTDGSANQTAGDVIIEPDGSCFSYNLNRWKDEGGGPTKVDGSGGFRIAQVAVDGEPSVGVVFMWVGVDTFECTDDFDAYDSADPWVEITDPAFVDITEFFVDDAASFEGSITDEDETITQRTRTLQVRLEGTLVRDDPIPITRQIVDVIKVRNDMITSVPII